MMVEQKDGNMTQQLSEVAMKLKGYETLLRVARDSAQRLKNDLIGTTRLLSDFLAGKNVFQGDVYDLCGVIGVFPDFAYYDESQSYVLDKSHLSRDNRFTAFIFEKRGEITQQAAGALGIDWEEIKND